MNVPVPVLLPAALSDPTRGAQALTEFSENLSLAYPHSHGFTDGGLVLGQLQGYEARLVRLCLETGQSEVLLAFPRSAEPEKRLWFDIAPFANRLVTVARNSLWLVDLDAPGSPPRLLHTAEAPSAIHPIAAVSADGRRVVFAVQRGESWTICRLECASGRVEELLTVPWFANHVQLSGLDEDWIGFAHEGPTETVPDRVWAWHPRHAPRGRVIFDQFARDPARALYVGHECWSHHDLSAIVIAYGGSPGSPRGVFEAFADGRPQRLVSEGDRDWHVNISANGRWLLVDTTGPHDRPGRGWHLADGVSDILLVDYLTGERQFLARSRIGQHHIHPHPTFSPDGRWIYYNESDEDGQRSRVLRVENPWYRAEPAYRLPT